MNRIVLLVFVVLFMPPALFGWEDTGVASWYGGVFQGRKTANGEIFDTYNLTCAHKTLPFGTVLMVTRLDNGLTVNVRVNDRGPFVEGRIIDLSYAAAKELDMIKDGTAMVKIEVKSDEVPKMIFRVQVGAWADVDNARLHRKRLEEAGFLPETVLRSDGIIRIGLSELDENSVFSTVEALESLGYADLFIYQE